jgi:cytochrome c biogenesis protein CcmG/thiol:disulfide interchange protein DsbE
MLLRNLLVVFLFSFLAMGCSKSHLSLHDSNGHLVPTASFSGKWVIISYWAAWCDGCAEEVPELNYFYQHNSNKNILLYGVNDDQLPSNDLQQAIRKMKMLYPSLLEDPSAVWQLGETNVLPTLFIINPIGKVKKKIIGSVTAQDLLKIINKLQQDDNNEEKVK